MLRFTQFLLLLLISCNTNTKNPPELINSQKETAVLTPIKTYDEVIDSIKKANIKESRHEYFSVKASEDNQGNLHIVGSSMNSNALESTKNKFKTINSKVQFDLRVLPDLKALNNYSYAIVKVSVTPLRGNPRHSAEQIDQAIMGDKVKLLDVDDDWYLIQTNYNYIAWVTEWSLKLMTTDEINNWEAKEKVTYTEAVGKIYSAKDEKAQQISDIVVGAEIRKIKDEGIWTKVLSPNGKEGYVQSKYIRSGSINLDAESKIKELIALGKTYMGVPYLWGGRSPKGFDCSGYTHTLFGFNGILLPRDADMQSFEGKEIKQDESFSNIKAGDLLFFGPNVNRITHVGISMGNYDFIHCSGEVRTNSFDVKNKEKYNDYLFKNLQKIRRIIN